MAAPMVDEALSKLLKAEQAAAKARSSPPAEEEDGRKKKRRRELDSDTDSAQQVTLLCEVQLAPALLMQGASSAAPKSQLGQRQPEL